jgi:hypothetical protein
MEVLDILKEFLDDFTKQSRLLVTTFDDHLLVDGATASPHLHPHPIEERDETDSKRPIEWLLLSPLALKYLRPLLLEVNRSSNLTFLRSRLTIFWRLVADTRGVWRCSRSGWREKGSVL